MNSVSLGAKTVTSQELNGREIVKHSGDLVSCFVSLDVSCDMSVLVGMIQEVQERHCAEFITWRYVQIEVHDM